MEVFVCFQFLWLLVLFVPTVNSVKYKIDLGDDVVATGTLRTDQDGHLVVRIRPTYFPVYITDKIRADFETYRTQVQKLAAGGTIKLAGPYMLFPPEEGQEYRIGGNGRNITIPNGVENNEPIIIPVVKVKPQGKEGVVSADLPNAAGPSPATMNSSSLRQSGNSRLNLSSSSGTAPSLRKVMFDSSSSGKSVLNVSASSNEKQKLKSKSTLLGSSGSFLSSKSKKDLVGIVIRKEAKIGKKVKDSEEYTFCYGKLTVNSSGERIIQIADEYGELNTQLLHEELTNKNNQFKHQINIGYQYHPFVYVCNQKLLQHPTSFDEIRANSQAVFGVKGILLQENTEPDTFDVNIVYTWIESEKTAESPYTHTIDFCQGFFPHTVIGIVDFRTMTIRISIDEKKNPAIIAFEKVQDVTFTISGPNSLSEGSDKRITAIGDKSLAICDNGYITKKIISLGDVFAV